MLRHMNDAAKLQVITALRRAQHAALEAPHERRALIREAWAGGMTDGEIAAAVGMSRSAVSLIRRGRRGPAEREAV